MKYSVDCNNCKTEIFFESDQPSGAIEHLICSCYKPVDVRIPSGRESEKGLRNMASETVKLRTSIQYIFADLQMPMTVRQVYYRLISMGFDKTEKQYDFVQNQLVKMRKSGLLPYDLIQDNSRSHYASYSNTSLNEFLVEMKNNYRLDFWANKNEKPIIFLEKEALRTVFYDVTYQHHVTLFASKGFASLGFLNVAFQEIKKLQSEGKTVFVYSFSDYDPSGVAAVNATKNNLTQMGVKNVYFEQIGIKEEHITEYNLPTRITKIAHNNHAKNFHDDRSVELDALHPRELKNMLKTAILRHISETEITQLKQSEAYDRRILDKFVSNLS